MNKLHIMAENNLNNKEALEKLKGIVDQIDVGTVCSFPSDSYYPHGVPMSRQEVDANGDIWYICSAEVRRLKIFHRIPKFPYFMSIPKPTPF